MVGETVIVDCRSTSNKTLTWLKQNISEERAGPITNSTNGKVLLQLQQKYHVEEPAEGHSRLKILNFQLSDEGMFICKESSADKSIANMTLTGKLS